MADKRYVISGLLTGGLLALVLVLVLFSGDLSTRKTLTITPALYVFGDSTVDSGNNNFLATKAKADFAPYGVDLADGSPLGRFTNGLTFADFIAQYLGLPPPPPFLSFKDPQSRKAIQTGLNFASGSCGILNHTGAISGKCLSLAEQVDSFQITVTQDSQQPGKRDPRQDHVAESVVLISMAGNDYTLGYFFNPTMTKKYDPATYTQLMIQSFMASIERIVKLGAKRFIVLGMPQIGCSAPFLLRNRGKCDEQVNKIIASYNSQITADLTKVGTDWGIRYTIIVPEKIDIRQVAAETKLKSALEPCCQVDPFGICIKDSKPCNNRDDHLIFDAVHPSQVYHRYIATNCFNGTGTCMPANVLQLCRSGG
ncbi:hypothetical protein MLD38_007473 [Melastoma candidum]|uniref:Uncharacterized protein n=1 Tax=Melastoma candidum TaxID=119954 RepID=A0ACB9RT58_9MYRT|nr:hypothetical protein MLD38_007473 [Melastoma candidum]